MYLYSELEFNQTITGGVIDDWTGFGPIFPRGRILSDLVLRGALTELYQIRQKLKPINKP